jgi:excisionase family DNA binding protein
MTATLGSAIDPDTASVAVPVVFTIAEAARLLNVPLGWLSKKVSSREVPHTRLGKHVRFTAEHIQLIIAAGEQQPAALVSSSGVSRRARRAG